MTSFDNSFSQLIGIVIIMVLVALFAAPIIIAVCMHASGALLVKIIIGELIVSAVAGFGLLYAFAQGMSR